MTPPPSTPTPWRFIIPSRATAPSPTPATAVAPRFQSTPRFGSASVILSTQKGRRTGPDEIEEDEDEVRESSIEDEDEVVDEIEGEDGDEDGALLVQEKPSHRELLDMISTASTPSQDQAHVLTHYSSDVASPRPVETPHDRLDEGSRQKTPFLHRRGNKRRKLVVSHSPDGSQSLENDPEPFDDSSMDESSHDEGGSHQPSDNEGEVFEEQRKEQHQPTFNPPPRFKPLEGEAEAEGLPIAFSPQRRGVKYIPGGLAAELQGWLSEVKGWEGVESSHPDPLLRATIDEMRPGRRTYLVRARLENGSRSRRFILAGEGRLTGLGQRAELSVGSIVVVAQPVWHVQLEGEPWIVACDWHLE